MAAILVGNGINQLEGLAPDWNRLVENVAEHFQIDVSINNAMSMTMGFEQFVIPLLKAGHSERQVKEKIQEIIQNAICSGSSVEGFQWSETIHHKIMTLHGCHILTTNYDYCLERSFDPKFKPGQTTRAILYSKDRYQQVGEKKVWHIHGELRGPCSICLGYEQYAGELEKLRASLVEKAGGSYWLKEVMEKRLAPGNNWGHLLFTDDIYILGLSLDVSEMDIWWLLNYRAKQKVQEKLDIRNHIVYYETGKEDRKKKSMMEALEMEYRLVCGNEFRQKYKNILADINSCLGE